MPNRTIPLLLFFCVLFSFSAAPSQAQNNEPGSFEVLESNAHQLVVELTVPSFEIESILHEGRPYDRLSLPGWDRWGEPGQPELPAYSKLVGLPWPGAPHLAVVEIEEEVRTGVRLYPNPDFVVGDTPRGADLIEVFTLDAEAYGLDADYPGSFTGVTDSGWLREQPLFRLNLYPFQYNPLRQELRIARRLRVLVTFPTAPISAAGAAPTASAFRTILEQTVINYEALPQANLPPPGEGLQANAAGANYLMITHPDFYDALQELKSYRQSQGLSVSIVKTTAIYNQFSGGVKSPDAIRDFLENAYNTWNPKPEYVLLVGDADAEAAIVDPDNHGEIIGYDSGVPTDYLPAHYEATSVFINEVGPTPIDAWYAKLNGPDPYFDVLIGRIPARSPGDVSHVIDKIKNYEQTPVPGHWARRAVLVADDGKNNNPDEGLEFAKDMDFLSNLLPSSIVQTKMYAYDSSTSVREEVENGALLLAYSGHGNRNSWGRWTGSGSIFPKSEIRNMANGYKLPFMVVTNCSNGYFAASNTNRVLAEQFLLLPDRGGIAAFAAAAYSFPTPNSIMGQEIAKVLFQDDVLVLGPATTIARLRAKEEGFRQWRMDASLFELFTYFGDPALRLNVPPMLILTGYTPDDKVKPGDVITYQLTYSVTEAGVARDLTLVNTLPGDVTYQSASKPPTSIKGRTLTWELGDVPQGSYNLTVRVVVDTEGLAEGDELVNKIRLSHIHDIEKQVWIDSTVVSNKGDAPQVRFSVEHGTEEQRVGRPVIFHNQTTGTAPIEYQWDFGDGSDLVAAVSKESVTHTYQTSGVYEVTLIATNSFGSHSRSLAIMVKEADEPIKPPKAAFIVGSGPHRPKRTLLFENISEGGGAAPEDITYLWDFGDGHTSNEMHGQNTYNSPGEYTVWLTVSNSLGQDRVSHPIRIEAEQQQTFLPVVVRYGRR